ncbi:ABC transporter substrate-binding protein [Phyllobacterium myrsinacearum]|uniref:Iron ABC transporter substrate-binding protein n=1 Tax=Phyllobacterium myrsinacearum TaxID=28101 RepID=A0A2S9JQH5_9HYPH|nr:ABC transporter substrate-binding protein [Phyllobacterium myrsinacearum]PRD55409.1 iron ABC transporter substrate-binding protein [Phyllobacterium myrsinacearum]PWV91746.1 iron(III) transport system substrate-binding protein [Phyllobacterium myrsinacearum]RZS77411.1 iron(III) transport system substrate-binding protein [Phyllobacterium myrsinacearum]RZV05816.1 iron(III) transport system substrate-binding protein [Phyllobacterium myrsinacearum]
MKKLLLTAAVFFVATGGALSAERLSVLCGADERWCAEMKTSFEQKSGTRVSMVRKSTGEILAQLRAEKDNPKVDVWWGGTGDLQLQAASEGLLEKYVSPNKADLLGWANNFEEISKGQASGIYAGALGFAYNADILRKKGLPAPTCWKDLTNGTYRGEIQIANPASSGTAYTALATLVQLFGEDESFKYFKALDANVNSYTKSGSAPVKAAARGETLIGIAFMHDAVTLKQAGFPLEVVAPCEGTGYEIGAVSIVKGARNIESAKAFVDYALSPEGQATGKAAGQNQVPSNAKSEVPDGAPDITSLKLIDYDFAIYGASETRDRLLARFATEIKAADAQ